MRLTSVFPFSQYPIKSRLGNFRVPFASSITNTNLPERRIRATREKTAYVYLIKQGKNSLVAHFGWFAFSECFWHLYDVREENMCRGKKIVLRFLVLIAENVSTHTIRERKIRRSDWHYSLRVRQQSQSYASHTHTHTHTTNQFKLFPEYICKITIIVINSFHNSNIIHLRGK